MRFSPPIVVLAITAGMVAGTAWLVPARQATQVVVTLPAATYQQLAGWGDAATRTDGRSLTVTQVIEELASNRANIRPAPANRADARVE